MSGHPWEVCRGGNSTHISLYVMSDERGWWLALAGSSYERSVETIRFYLALTQQRLPIFLYDWCALDTMLNGRDYIGIVPEGIIPRYCSDMFPEEEMLSYMNLPWENTNDVIKAVIWYSLNDVKLKV